MFCFRKLRINENGGNTVMIFMAIALSDDYLYWWMGLLLMYLNFVFLGHIGCIINIHETLFVLKGS